MPWPGFAFELERTAAASRARAALFHTPRGTVATPAFMPVGTCGTVKGILPEQLRATGAQILLANAYHLALRPGAEVVARLGGLHAFMQWPGPILTDSGGFQLVSLAERVRVSHQAAVFRSHIDGALLEWTPEEALRVQRLLGSDIAMVLDDAVPLPASRQRLAEAVERTLHWAVRSLEAPRAPGQAVFAIVQGGLERDLRSECAARLADLDFAGYAVGGLSVGEPPPAMYEVLDYTVPLLPAHRPRYLMGVGRPQDLLEAIWRGIDLFDCVLPTRNGRNALAFTAHGPLKLRNRRHAEDNRPLEEDCPCPACRFSRGYVRHLFMSEEMLGPVLLSIHNLTFYQRLMAAARAAILRGDFERFCRERLAAFEGPSAD
jgi:queuine tRNA-ribosyltransferase